MNTLERMDSFFEKRVEEYDEHMLNEVEGCKEGYIKMAQLIPDGTQNLLDLGCGTGLELDEIFKIHPHIHVTGIDLTKAMLCRLRQKHPDKNIRLICDDYFKTDFGKESFDGEKAKKLVALLRAFVTRGGIEMQVNALDRKTLLDAKKNPDAHRDLTVRIGGYSDYFVRLSETLQNEIIDRTEY